MVKIVAATCPRCGASIELPTDLKKAHCVYCGASIIIAADGSQKAECRICDGYGRLQPCKACGGKGNCTWTRSKDSLMETPKATYVAKGDAHCEDGMCSACGGTGMNGFGLPCLFCQSYGKCPVCHGSGKCPVCKGVGSTPDPRGSEVCHVCNGSGMVEIERAEVRWSDPCPVCKTARPIEGSFCPRCGLAHRCPKCGKEWGGNDAKCPSCGYERGTKP
jgi:DNA-directed RNA polymerase subunit RPC12/RpoP